MLTRIAFGFHSATALIALVMLSLGGQSAASGTLSTHGWVKRAYLPRSFARRQRGNRDLFQQGECEPVRVGLGRQFPDPSVRNLEGELPSPALKSRAVDRNDGSVDGSVGLGQGGYDRFVALRSHYGFDSFFCEPSEAGVHENVTVEPNITAVRHRHVIVVRLAGSAQEY